MLRPVSVLPALAAVVASVALPVGLQVALPPGGPLAAAPARAMPALSAGETAPKVGRLPASPAAPAAEGDTPLAVTIDALTPSYLPKAGPIRVTGSVTNNDEAPWSTVNTFAFISEAPMTSSAELAAATRTDPAAYVGARITAPGTYDTLDRIDPGQTRQFRIKLPRTAVEVSEPGVYWFGIHALGEGPDGRLEGADGRARTFLPLVGESRRTVDTALVVPLRRQVSHAADGSLEDVDAWTRTLSAGGRLRSLVDFGASAGSRPLTWLLDPALPEAVRALTLGNPPRSLTPIIAAGSDTPSASPEVTPEPEPNAPPAEPTTENPSSVEAVGAADAWLNRLREGLQASQILALPYGDLDVSAAAARSPSLYDTARRRSGTVLEPWGLRMSPAVAAPTGYLDAAAIAAVEDPTTVLVTDRMFRGEAPTVARTTGTRLVPTSSGAAWGGPGPGARLASVALRQRILSEAALRLLSPGRPPLVVVFPQHWAPTATTGFFEGLDVDWLNLTTVEDAMDRKGRAVSVADLHYPARQGRLELDAANFASAQALMEAGDTLQNVLTEASSVDGTVAAEALEGTSYAARRHPDAARASADRSRARIDEQLAAISISAPRSVTLSSASGRFAATLTNNLDVPVTVSIGAQFDKPLELSVPTSVDIPAREATTVLLNASTRTPGIHNVTLLVTDTDGRPLGGTDTLPIRSAQVSGVIWVILGAGVALLFGAIAVRLFRRVRAAGRAARAAGG